MRSGISRTASAPGWQEAGVLNGATPNRCMNIAMKSATRPCTRRPPLKAILIIILTHALVHASKHPPPPSHPTARPPTRPCAITQRCKRPVSLQTEGWLRPCNPAPNSRAASRQRNPARTRDSVARAFHRGKATPQGMTRPLQ